MDVLALDRHNIRASHKTCNICQVIWVKKSFALSFSSEPQLNLLQGVVVLEEFCKVSFQTYHVLRLA